MPFSRSRSIESMHALGNVLVGAEGARLPEHRVDQRGLAVVDVGDDGDVAQVLAGDDGHDSSGWWRRTCSSSVSRTQRRVSWSAMR